MLHDKLKQQITEHLGKNPVLTPQLTALFESIGTVYSETDAKLSTCAIDLSRLTENLTECLHNFIQLSELFEQVSARLNGFRKYVSTDPQEQESTQTLELSLLLKLISNLEDFVKGLVTKYETNEKKLVELENINKELDQFAYIVSHDLKAPLRAISNLSQWIQDDIEHLMNQQSKDNFTLLRSRVYRMESLINAILTYSKSTKSKSKTEISDTGWLLNEVIDSLNCPKNISITVNGKFPVIETESIKLQQVFANLISNSIKYNDKTTGKIEVGFFETEDSCQFYVQDNGPGIEPQYQKKVFMIFQTLEAKDDYESTGIGLAIVKKIIEEKGGKIWIESENGKGAKFVFVWPKIKNNVLLKNIDHGN